PEQAKDSDAADKRSDIYSLGCTVFHLLTGRAPFPDGSMVERMYKHLEAKPPDIRELNKSVPPGLAYILAKMLEKKPEDRYQKVEEILQDLKRMAKLGQSSEATTDILSGLLEGAPPAAAAKAPRPDTDAPVRTQVDVPAGAAKA